MQGMGMGRGPVSRRLPRRGEKWVAGRRCAPAGGPLLGLPFLVA